MNNYFQEFNQYSNDIKDLFKDKKNTAISLYNFFNEFKTNFLYFDQSIFQYYIYMIASFYLHQHNQTTNDEKTINKTDIYSLYKYNFSDVTFSQHINNINSQLNTYLLIYDYISLKIYNKFYNDSFFNTLDQIHKSFELVDDHPISKDISVINNPPLDLIKNYQYYTNYEPRTISSLQELIQAQENEIDSIINENNNNNKISLEEFFNTSNLGKKYLYLAVLRLEMFYYEHGVKNFEEFYTKIIGKNISNKNMYKYLFNDNEETKFNDKSYQKNFELFFSKFMYKRSVIYFFISKVYPIKILDAFNEYENL